MNEEKKQLLIDALNRDFVKKNKIIAISCLAATIVIVILSILSKNTIFSLIGLPFVLVALFALINSKKYSKSETINSLVFTEEVCTAKTNELSTTGNIRYLEFSNHLRYDISFSEGSMYTKAQAGSRFYLAIDPKKNSILSILPNPEDEANADRKKSLVNLATETILDKDALPGLTVSLKNMMDLNDHPIIVCNQIHRIFFLNQAAKYRFSVDEDSITKKSTIFEFIPAECLISIQKALLKFSEDETCNKTGGWKNEDGSEIEVFALRNNINKLSGYYLQEK